MVSRLGENNPSSKAFTLIELLIVVAIIAILAAIAVPNFLEAQTRSKVSRVKADMRSLDTALSAYFTDNNHFPLDVHGIEEATYGTYLDITDLNLKYYFIWHSGKPLTTPVAYMTSVSFTDPFGHWTDPEARTIGIDIWKHMYSFQYYDQSNDYSWGRVLDDLNIPYRVKTGASLVSLGPDGALTAGEWSFADPDGFTLDGRAYIYDPTNGTVSIGDIVRGVGGLTGGPRLGP
jgi:prepilin-type N-terminal cleavage/methylation domain-containing protein